LINILRSKYNEFYHISKKRLFISNGIIIFAIILKVGWMIYVAVDGLNLEGIMHVVN
jgi:hypothetical protein